MLFRNDTDDWREKLFQAIPEESDFLEIENPNYDVATIDVNTDKQPTNKTTLRRSTHERKQPQRYSDYNMENK